MGSRHSLLFREDGSVVTWGRDSADSDGSPSLCCSSHNLGSVRFDGQLAANSLFQMMVLFQRWVGFRHKRLAAFLLNLPDHFIARDLLPFSENLNMPGIPGVPKGIDGIVTIKQTYAVVGGVTAHSMEYQSTTL